MGFDFASRVLNLVILDSFEVGSCGNFGVFGLGVVLGLVQASISVNFGVLGTFLG